MSVGKKVDAVLKELEARLRGGQNYAAADHELLKASYEIFETYHQCLEKLATDHPENVHRDSPVLMNLDEEQRKAMLALAIKLHNKIRNVTSLNGETKNVLKGL
jgi:hypothetical protein